jgi:multiple sugar transport system permease protein
MRKNTVQKIGIYFFLVCTLILFLGPIVWIFALSIRPPESAFQYPPTLIFKPTLDAFHHVFVSPGIQLRQLFNSIIISLGAVVINLPLSFLAAYALSRFPIKRKGLIMGWYLGLLMAPPVVFLIPYFILMNNIGLSGTHLSIILVLQLITIPFSVWLLKSFIDDIPLEIEEAAQIDGAGTWKILRSITFPLCGPGIIVTTMFAFVFAWNNAIFPIVLSVQKTATIQIGAFSYFGASGVQWSVIGAIAVAAMVVPMVIFLVLDKFVVRGLTFGSVKG